MLLFLISGFALFIDLFALVGCCIFLGIRCNFYDLSKNCRSRVRVFNNLGVFIIFAKLVKFLRINTFH